MIDAVRRFPFLVSLACLVLAPVSVQAGDHPWFHHHGYYSRTKTVTHGVPPTGVVGVAAASGFQTVMPASGFQMVMPASSFQTVMPASSFQSMMPASGFQTILPASGFQTILPASGFSTGFAPSNSAPSSFGASSLAPMAASSAATAHAFSASENEAQTAQASFPSLAAAAQRRNLNGGRFVVFLRSLLRGSLTQLTGPVGTGTIAILRPLIHDLIRNQLGADPAEPGIGREIESLLDNVLGGGADDGGGASDNSRCFTIRVCIEGAAPRISTGTVNSPAPATGGNHQSPVFGLPAAGPSGQAPVSPPQGQVGPANGNVSAPPPAPADEPDATPTLPSPNTPETTLNGNDDKNRHEAIMSVLGGINDSLKKLAEAKASDTGNR